MPSNRARRGIAQRQSRRRRHLLTGVVSATGVVVLVVLAVVAFAGGKPSKTTGTATAEAFDLPALEGGGRVRLAAFRGTPVVVNIFASWCSQCRKELPEFAAAASRLRGKVDFVGVDSQETGKGRAFADRYHLAASGFTLAEDLGGTSGGGLYQAYAAHGLPLTAFYSASGQLLWKANARVPESTLRQKLAHYYGV